jgi:hypothetical protein
MPERSKILTPSRRSILRCSDCVLRVPECSDIRIRIGMSGGCNFGTAVTTERAR